MQLSKKFLKKTNYALILLIIPGFITSAIIANKAIYILFLILSFIYLYYEKRFFSYLLLIVLAIVDRAFISLYFALIFYSVYKRDNFLLILSIILFAFNANYFNYYEYVDKKPRGYFLDIFGVYFLIFSPLVFIYFLYSLYKSWFLKKDILFFISFFSFVVSIILSFRQKIKVYDYAPFVIPFLIYMFKVFLYSYKVRLPKFRVFYKVFFILAISSVMLFDIFVFFSPYTPFKKDSILFVKPLVNFLKSNNINYIKCNNKSLQKTLDFYGIKEGNNYKLIYLKNKNLIKIYGKRKYVLNVSKLNTK